MHFITSEPLRDVFQEKKASYCVDGAPAHMHASMCKVMHKLGTNCMFPHQIAQACDKVEVNKKLNCEMEELFNPWVIHVC